MCPLFHCDELVLLGRLAEGSAQNDRPLVPKSRVVLNFLLPRQVDGRKFKLHEYRKARGGWTEMGVADTLIVYASILYGG
jgi:hypothetical protein